MPYRVQYSYENGPWAAYGDYEDGAVAGRYLKDCQRGHPAARGYRWRIQKLRDDGLPEDWREREQARFNRGDYERVPWADAEWYQPFVNEHFCHLSLKQPGKIAYTESAQKGEQDRQTIIGAGRYLTRYFADKLTASEIETLACQVSVEADACGLKITQDADEIEEVYVNGPRSCMSGDAREYNGHCHPARVYAGPDLGLAYTGAREKASGRCVVWPEKKLYGTIYGDNRRMEMLLQEAGYKRDFFWGARFRRLPDGEGFVLPYIDGWSEVGDDGTYLIIGGNGIGCQSTDGLSEIHGSLCSNCEDRTDDDDLIYIDETEEYYCEHCAGHYTTYCELSDERLLDDRHDFVEVNIGERWPITACADHSDVIYVEETDTYWTQDGLDRHAAELRSERARRGWETRRRRTVEAPLQLAA